VWAKPGFGRNMFNWIRTSDFSPGYIRAKAPGGKSPKSSTSCPDAPSMPSRWGDSEDR